KVRREGGEKVGNRLITAFAGLMLARMLGYVALLMAAVFMGMGEPVSVCIGLVGGTLVFQPLEILYFKQSH
ncbi:MAG: hypothetical protein ACE5HU_10410, partial [Acidobacteriota bacterium]